MTVHGHAHTITLHNAQEFGMSLVIALWDASIVFGSAVSGMYMHINC